MTIESFTIPPLLVYVGLALLSYLAGKNILPKPKPNDPNVPPTPNVPGLPGLLEMILKMLLERFNVQLSTVPSIQHAQVAEPAWVAQLRADVQELKAKLK